MARVKGPRKVHRYSVEFKLKAVKLSDLAGVQVQDVADALEIHPFYCRDGAERLERDSFGPELR
jgi:transposase-like protein